MAMPSEPMSVDGASPAVPDPAIARAFVYGYLARAFAYPTKTILDDLKAARDDLAIAVSVLGFVCDLGSLDDALSESEKRLPALCGSHNALFATTLVAPARETAYELDKTARRAAELADICGFYAAFGLELAAPVEADGIEAELEFMSLLNQKEAAARCADKTEGAAVCRGAAQAFLADHLARWYGVFAERLRAASEDPYYRALADLLVAFLAHEVARLPAAPPCLAHYSAQTAEGATWICSAGPAIRA